MKSQRPLLSIVIPTRERGRYLRHCLDTAVACKDPRVEVLVSDNASEDNTAAIFTEPQYANVRYVRTSQRVPISLNFESAFSNASGQYILYIGDDDAVLPRGIGDLLEVLETRAPDIVSWPSIGYYWPDGDVNGLLTIKRRRIRGGLQDLDPEQLMRKVCAGQWAGNAVHCGCISRDLVQTVASIAGRYFYDTTPDSSGFGALALAKSYVFLNRPVTVYGRSPVSHTTQYFTLESRSYDAFVAETASDVSEEALDLRCRSIFGLSFAGLVLTRRLLRLSSPAIGFEKWKERIIRDLIFAPMQSRSEQAGFINQWFVRNQFPPIDLKLLERLPPNGAVASMQRRKSKPKVSLTAAIIETGPHFMQDVNSAVQIAENIIGPAALVRQAPWLIALKRWLGAMLRARRAKWLAATEQSIASDDAQLRE